MRTTVGISTGRERALETARGVLRLRHYSLATEEAYLGWIGRYVDFLTDPKGGAALAEQSSERKVEAFLTQRARDGVAASTQNQAFNALCFFYKQVRKQPLGDVKALRARRAERIRVAPPVEHVRALLAAVGDHGGYPTRLIVRMLYGCGLRVSEPLNLRIRDVLLKESRLVIREAKGNKDRIVELPCEIAEELRVQLLQARAVSARDRQNGIPVALPGKQRGKLIRLAFDPGWAWVFPMRDTCRHPRTGELVRYRILECNVQRAVRRAADKAGLGAEFVPHILRHAYATHAKLHLGADLIDLRGALGHKQVETTMRYLAGACSPVASPLSLLNP